MARKRTLSPPPPVSSDNDTSGGVWGIALIDRWKTGHLAAAYALSADAVAE